ncbi:helix-turn-helix domain-containing protein [Paenibacillus solisilvae]|uniref:Helix-turn-helix domain-containing protein n=1 Tax=Paenibacillus solisilvae TaxID=2486751 RepID=A0ABW0VXL6_9BACL
MIFVLWQIGENGMAAIKKQEDFREQRLFVLPEYMQRELVNTALTSSLFVSDIGFFPHAKNHFRERPEGSDAYIFIYCIDGEGWIERDGRRADRLSPGNLIVIPSETAHRYWASDHDPWSIYWFHLKGQHVGELIRLYGLDGDPLLLPIGSVSGFVEGMDQAYAILADKPYSLPSHVHVSQTIRHLISGIGLSIERSTSGRKKEQHLEKAVRYLTDHTAGSINLPELAKHIGLSKQHLIHLFKQETGFSPIDYYLRMKMQRAAQMLDLTSLTVKEISGSIGISDPYYFSRLFKKFMGCSPTDYRKIPKG